MTVKLTKVMTLVLTLLLSFFSENSIATNTSSQSLGNQAGAVDVWTFSCPAQFPNGRFFLIDITSVPLGLPVLQGVLGQVSQPSIEVTPGNESNAGAVLASVNGVSGNYVALIKKVATGGDTYSADLYCVDSAETRHNPTIIRQINQ